MIQKYPDFHSQHNIVLLDKNKNTSNEIGISPLQIGTVLIKTLLTGVQNNRLFYKGMWRRPAHGI